MSDYEGKTASDDYSDFWQRTKRREGELTAALHKSLDWTNELVAERDATIAAQAERIAELEAEHKHLRKMFSDQVVELGSIIDTNQRLLEELDRYRTAAGFTHNQLQRIVAERDELKVKLEEVNRQIARIEGGE